MEDHGKQPGLEAHHVPTGTGTHLIGMGFRAELVLNLRYLGYPIPACPQRTAETGKRIHSLLGRAL